MCETTYIDEGHGLVASGSNAKTLDVAPLGTSSPGTGSTSQSDAKQTQRSSSRERDYGETSLVSVTAQVRFTKYEHGRVLLYNSF